ncbi:MAG: hypothetical protein ISS84_01205 [Candidatus Pacebacteria bacterium]|nr:hypothetical protein [Candidatus Paceibacterota bacterium]
MKPKRKDKIKWSSNIAYAVGLLTTDGNLSNSRRHIDFTSKDIQLIKTFKKCLGIKNKIGLKTSGFSNKKYPRIQFSDVTLYNWLLGIGLTPKKSKTIGKLKIPDKYFFDFLRGHFDGDGCCYSYWDKRWDSSFMFYMKFLSASEEHILWLRYKIKNLINIKGDLTQSSRDHVYQLKYAKRESKILISKMYYKKNLPCLERKYRKLKTILEIDNKEANRLPELNGRVLELADSLD